MGRWKHKQTAGNRTKEVTEDKQIVSKCMSLASGASSLRSRGYAFGIAAVVFPEAKDQEKETLERPVFVNKPLLIHHCSKARLELNAKFLFLQLKRVRKPQQLPGLSCCGASPPAALLFLRARAWQIRRRVGRMGLSTSSSSGSRRHLSGVDDGAGEYSFKRFPAQWRSSTGFSEAPDPTRIDGGTITLAPEERLALPHESFANASAELRAENSASKSTHKVCASRYQCVEYSAVSLGLMHSPELLRRVFKNLGIDIAPFSTKGSASEHPLGR